MTEVVRWGVLSTARINDRVLSGLGGPRGGEGLDIVAIAGRDRERTAAYARERRIPRAHAGYEALLADPRALDRIVAAAVRIVEG